MTQFAFVFPGQGSQAVGMLADMAATWPVIEETFGEASAALGYDLWALAQQGPAEELNKTWQTQPALLTASVALYRVWQQQGGKAPTLLAGHSRDGSLLSQPVQTLDSLRAARHGTLDSEGIDLSESVELPHAARIADLRDAVLAAGTMSVCTGICGLTSSNASTRSSSYTFVDGISPATILQNRQSSLRMAPSPSFPCAAPSGRRVSVDEVFASLISPARCP